MINVFLSGCKEVFWFWLVFGCEVEVIGSYFFMKFEGWIFLV